LGKSVSPPTGELLSDGANIDVLQANFTPFLLVRTCGFDLVTYGFIFCKLLLKNRNQVFTKEKIYTTIYGYDAEGDSSTSITERIKKIREKFTGFHIDPVKTIWGVGYQWEIKKV